jgi:polyhydroxybutyrate depolymerase
MSSGGRILLLVSGLVLVAIGCAGGRDPADDGAAATTGAATTASSSTDGETSAAIPSPGCEEAGIASGSHDLGVSVDGAEYPYRIHVPTAAETGSPLPAVVGFHGFTQSIDQFEQMSGLP